MVRSLPSLLRRKSPPWKAKAKSAKEEKATVERELSLVDEVFDLILEFMAVVGVSPVLWWWW